MDEAEKEFSRLVSAVLARFFAQNGRAARAESERAALGARLWALVVERGLPRPLAKHERGEPGEMSEEEVAPLVARVLGEATDDALLTGAVKQLVKACFYPEFKTCRDSWCEADAGGACRRQDLARVRTRVSGAHCVDCPHWIALTPAQHEKFLAKNWRDGAAAFAAGREIFLPEDFRALRRWLHARARSEGSGAGRN
jgi:hypothetical protein